MAVSSWKDGFEKMGEALKESRIAVQQSCEDSRALREKANAAERQAVFSDAFAEETALLFQRGEMEKINAQLQAKLPQIQKGCWLKEQIQMEAVSFLIEIYKCLQERQELDVFCQFSYPDIMRQLQECKNEEQILNQVMQVIRQFQKKTKNEKKHSSYEEKAVLYMGTELYERHFA